MKRIVMIAMLLSLASCAPAFARGSTTNQPTVIPCTVGTNHKCVYPEATLKDKHIFQRLNRFLRKISK